MYNKFFRHNNPYLVFESTQFWIIGTQGIASLALSNRNISISNQRRLGGCLQGFTGQFDGGMFDQVVVHIYPVTGQRQVLFVGFYAHFSMEWLLCAGGICTCLQVFCDPINVPLDFFEFLYADLLLVWSHQAEIIILKASYPKMQQRDLGSPWTQIMRSRSLYKRHFYPLSHAADNNLALIS